MDIITDIGCKSLLRDKMVHLKPRSELFKKFAVLVYDGGEIGECQYYSLQGKIVLWQV